MTVLQLGYGEHIQLIIQLLNRFFSLHYLIPFLILGLVVLHIWALHVPGNNNPVGIDIKKPSKDTVPFHPYITIKDTFALLMFMIIFAGFVFFSPNVWVTQIIIFQQIH